MDFQDVVYLALLIFSVIFGYFFKQIPDLQQRKRVGTIIGLLIVLVVSGVHILHNLIFFVINTLIILYADKRKCHIISFVFSFLYLLFFRTTEYFGIPYPPSHTNLVQMMLTLRMLSVAFDVNQAHCNKKLNASGDSTEEAKAEKKYDEYEIDVVELFHYNFSYMGVLTGPFVKYRTFRDYYTLPFSKHAASNDALWEKMKFLPLYAGLHLLGTQYFPFSYAKSDEFFNERSVLYRFIYIWPTFFNFRMRLFIGFILSECTCISAGLGAYPVFTAPTSGGGPSKNFAQLEKSKNDEKLLAAEKYNFQTINAIDVYSTEFAPTFREGMRAWNMSVQYWFGVYIYKRCPIKSIRALITLFVSAMWHGVYLGHYICLGGAPFVLPIDGVWYKILLKGRTGWVHYVNGWVMLLISRFFFSYLAIAFHYLTVEWVMHYYNSIYHLGLIIGIVLYVGGLCILKVMPKGHLKAKDGEAVDKTKATLKKEH